ncbi:MAG TPA: TonB-dependent receptor plug domain-containing protein [Sphingomonadaceae bacterium]|nr:TonB-dependent receptor plug domain-containing protein [Sphingomonadaceae bacterium]
MKDETGAGKCLLAPIAAFALAVPAAAYGQTAGVAGDETEAENTLIAVTANRAPMRLDQVGQSMTVLDIKAIEASQAVGVTELLAQTPGVQFSRNGGPGKPTSLYISGAETCQTVILFDGVINIIGKALPRAAYGSVRLWF